MATSSTRFRIVHHSKLKTHSHRTSRSRSQSCFQWEEMLNKTNKITLKIKHKVTTFLRLETQTDKSIDQSGKLETDFDYN